MPINVKSDSIGSPTNSGSAVKKSNSEVKSLNSFTHLQPSQSLCMTICNPLHLTRCELLAAWNRASLVVDSFVAPDFVALMFASLFIDASVKDLG